MRLEVAQEKVGWDLKEDVWHEEDGECGVGLICLGVEVQILREAQGEGIADVHSRTGSVPIALFDGGKYTYQERQIHRL